MNAKVVFLCNDLQARQEALSCAAEVVARMRSDLVLRILLFLEAARSAAVGTGTRGARQRKTSDGQDRK